MPPILVIVDSDDTADQWTKIVTQMKRRGSIFVTGGLSREFPEALHPVGLDFAGPNFAVSQKMIPDLQARLAATLLRFKEPFEIWFIQDGRLQSWELTRDLIIMILTCEFPQKATLFAIEPASFNRNFAGFGRNDAVSIKHQLSAIDNAAVASLARAVSDRWIRAALAHQGISVSHQGELALLGATYLAIKAPKHTRSPVELGEVSLQARGTSGGRPFTGTIKLFMHEEASEAVIEFSREYKNRLIPGTVYPGMADGPDTPPRLLPFTAAALISEICRRYDVTPSDVGRALDHCFRSGALSNPRQNAGLPVRALSNIILIFGAFCGLERLSADNLTRSMTGDHAKNLIVPTLFATEGTLKRIREVVLSPLPELGASLASKELRRVCVTMAFHRMFDIAQRGHMETGRWQPSNSEHVPSDIARVLREVTWHRPPAYNLPWTHGLPTNTYAWPLPAVLMDLASSEELGQIDELPEIATNISASGQVAITEDGKALRINESGLQALNATPNALWNPATIRMIEAHVATPDDPTSEAALKSCQWRARRRVVEWLTVIPNDLRLMLGKALTPEERATLVGASQAGAANAASAVPAAMAS